MQRSSCIRVGRVVGVALFILAAGCVQTSPRAGKLFAPDRGRTPTGQLLTPVGRQVALPGMRPQALALSPDGRLLATAGKNRTLVLMDPASGKVLQSVPLSTTKGKAAPESEEDGVADIKPTDATNVITAQMSLAGLAFSPDGRRIFLSSTGGDVWSLPVSASHEVGQATVLPVPDADLKGHKDEIPTGLAVSADGKRLYVAGTLANRLHELDATSGKLLRSWDTGVAPQDVVRVGSKAYVSNRGGRRPGSGDVTAPAGKGTVVRVDAVRRIASEGSVTVIDLATGQVTAEVLVGLHASALAVSPSGKYVVVANSGSDTLNVIDTGTDRVIEKIWTRQTPADLFGAQPNAMVFEPSGRRLYVCNGTQNAVAVVEFEPEKNASKVIGLIPTGWFPGAIQFDAARRTLCVANMRGMGAAKVFETNAPVKLNTKDFYGTVSLAPIPSQRQLVALTKRALHNMHYPRLAQALLPARPDEPPRPVPERVGEPSVFKHVIYIIKENRTYDQMLGDMPEGNGDASLCIFGEKYTPNQHELAREFVLLDNTYCAGVQSADGHQWTDSAIANEYTERQISSDTPRSYPGGKNAEGSDALAWASSGFIWDNVLAHGKTFRNYGEWMASEAGWTDRKRKESVRWQDFWREHQKGEGRVQLRSHPAIESLRPYSSTNTVGWDLKVPDVMRAAAFIRDLRQFETNGGFPNLTLLFLPNDHSGGTRGQYPTPGAQVADNDLALGQVVEAVSHSRFWRETCIVVIEDDPQAGWDHVSGYRTLCFVVSPYTKRRQTISTHFNQTSVIRTIELMLGLPPMNQMDATATPMSDCFTETPDFTPFTSVPNHVPLDQLNPDAKQVSHPVLQHDALVSSRLPLDEVDRCPEDVFNRILWRAMRGPDVPYPEWAVKLVEDDD